jgi:hypothetical protein
MKGRRLLDGTLRDFPPDVLARLVRSRAISCHLSSITEACEREHVTVGIANWDSAISGGRYGARPVVGCQRHIRLLGGCPGRLPGFQSGREVA